MSSLRSPHARLTAVGILLVLAATGCGLGGSSGAGSGNSAGAAQTTEPPTTTTTIPKLDPIVAYSSPVNEVEPELKKAAATTLQALFTYEVGQGTPAAAAQRIAGLPVVPEVVAKAAPLLFPDMAAAADIVYPQLGGLTPSKSSVMTVVTIRTLRGAERSTVTRTMDVRLERRAGVWTVVDLPSLGGQRLERPATLSPAAQRALDHPQIQMADSARWDIYSGKVADRVLEIMASIADTQPIGVAVLSTGHPIEVFGSTRPSNHTSGRAVDLWKVGVPVIDQRDPNGPLRPLVQRLLTEGVTELGGPFDLDGAKPANFANTVHFDHLHIGFDRL